MLQRKQSLYLLIAVLAVVAMNFLPLANYGGGADRVVFRTAGLFHADGSLVEEAQPRIPFQALSAALGLMLAVSIFLFKNRPRQARVVRATWLISGGLWGGLFVAHRSIAGWMSQPGGEGGTLGVAFFLPLVVLVCAVLAERAIKADEALIRSVDRLR